jgi:hypothetical protein
MVAFPGVVEDFSSHAVENSLLVIVFIIDGFGVAVFSRSETVVGPERVIESECFLGVKIIPDYRNRTVLSLDNSSYHIDTKDRIVVLFSLIERTHTDSDFDTHLFYYNLSVDDIINSFFQFAFFVENLQI